MKKTVLFFLILSLTSRATLATDREWSTAKLTENLNKGHFGSRFHFEMEKNRAPFIPDVTAVAELQLGLLNQWQLNLELREDFVFYSNSVALTNQVELMQPEDSIYNLTVTAYLRYRFMVDRHSEFSGKILVNHGMLNNRLSFGANAFVEAISRDDQGYGVSTHFMGYLMRGWSVGVEKQLRIDVIKYHPDLLIGLNSHFNIKTEAIPIYYMYHNKRIWNSGKIIRAVDADISFMKGVTDLAPKWVLSIGLSLSL